MEMMTTLPRLTLPCPGIQANPEPGKGHQVPPFYFLCFLAYELQMILQWYYGVISTYQWKNILDVI